MSTDDLSRAAQRARELAQAAQLLEAFADALPGVDPTDRVKPGAKTPRDFLWELYCAASDAWDAVKDEAEREDEPRPEVVEASAAMLAKAREVLSLPSAPDRDELVRELRGILGDYDHPGYEQWSVGATWVDCDADVLLDVIARGLLARGLVRTPTAVTAEQFAAARQAADDEALTRTGRSIGDLASEHVVRAAFEAAGLSVEGGGQGE